jgi:putative transposase
VARLPRLALADQVHWLSQRGNSGRAVFADDADRRSYLACADAAARSLPLKLHAYALRDNEVHWLVTPAEGGAVSRWMQALGRSYVSTHHRRHGGSGSLWDGRFRCALVEPGATMLEVLCLLDGLPGPSASALSSGAGGRLGAEAPLLPLADPTEYWTLGNTPFDRQARWRQRVTEGVGAQRSVALLAAARGSWVVGSVAFANSLADLAARRTQPRPRGRPRKAAGI